MTERRFPQSEESKKLVASIMTETRERRHDYHFDWTVIANGALYRLVMRIAHRFGWCYTRPSDVEPGRVWCQWCGMRGRR